MDGIIYLPSSCKLLDYTATTKSSARKAGTTVLTIKLEISDPRDAGYLLSELAEIDREQRPPLKPARPGRAEQGLSREIAASPPLLRLTHCRED